MTRLEEPLYSIDPFNWSVYGDWLEDQGIDPSRVRNIVKGLKITEGLLYLEYLYGSLEDHNFHLSHLCRKDCKDIREDLPIRGWRYRWNYCPIDTYSYAINPQGINHVILPKIIEHIPTLLPAFWKKIEEVGSSR